MPRLRVHNIAVSLDGFAAGPHQNLEHPMGVGSQDLHKWVFESAWGAAHFDFITDEGRAETIDDEFLKAGDEGIGATIMGRNMFGPIRGDWPDDEWKGWWGPEPPYHHDVFVLTHYERSPLEMDGTTFYFVTDGIQSAYDRAFAAADGKDVRLGGGASVIRQYLAAGLVDEAHLAIVPVLLGDGERVLDAGVAPPDGYEVTEFVPSDHVLHARISRR